MTKCVCCVMYHSVTRQPVGCAHIGDLAEIIYYLGISKAQRRKFVTFPPDASVRQIRHISTGQRSIVVAPSSNHLTVRNLTVRNNKVHYLCLQVLCK